MIYKLAETFYSVQGEGEWSGVAAFFIRLAGCNIGCEFCDTKYDELFTANEDALVQMALQYPARKVVITGGEPTLQDTQPLAVALRRAGFKVHLETNGTQKTHRDWDWITVSPKPGVIPVLTSVAFAANEFKFLCGFPHWRSFMEDFMKECRFDMTKADNPIVWLMPLAKAAPSTGLVDSTMAAAYNYVKENPRVKLCLQIHKVLGVR